MTTTVRWLRSAEEVQRSAGTLRAVAESSERSLPAADPDFLRSYVRHFEYSPSPPIPEVAIVERDGKAIGFLATRVNRHPVAPGLRVRERTLLVTHDHDRVNMVCAPGEGDAVAIALADALLSPGNPAALDIAGLEVGSALHRALHQRAQRSRSWAAFDVALPSFCSVPVRWDSTAAYFAALSKSMRSNVSRQTRRLFAAGHVELLRATGSADVAPLFASYLDLEQRSWKYAANAGVLRSPKRTAFFAEVVGGNAAYEPSLVGVLLDGQLIAALLLGHFGTGMWALEMCFDEDHRDLGAGQVLLLLAMHEAIASGCVAVGYLQHFAYFKTRWLADETAVVSTRVVRRGSPLHVRHILGTLAHRDTTPDQSIPDLASPTRDSPVGQVADADARPSRLPDASTASRRLVAGGLRPHLLTGPADAGQILPFPLR